MFQKNAASPNSPSAATFPKHWYPLCNPDCINIPDARGGISSSSGSGVDDSTGSGSTRGSRLVSGGTGVSHPQKARSVAHQQKHSRQRKRERERERRRGIKMVGRKVREQKKREKDTERERDQDERCKDKTSE